MILFVGLGNPGERFENTCHNAGFMFIDHLADSLGAFSWKAQFSGLTAQAHHPKLGEILLLKPQTFMNLSGQSVAACQQFFKILPRHIVVAHDELDLLPGQIKLKDGGSARGHNGVRSIHQNLGTDQYRRFLIGIGRPETNIPVDSHVLSHFSKSDLTAVTQIISETVMNLDRFISEASA